MKIYLSVQAESILLTTIQAIKSSLISGLPGIKHGFFTREGGVSQGIYASLNCGLGSQDSAENVMENRARIARHLGGQKAEIFTVYQVHSSSTFTVDAKNERPRSLPKADAIISTLPGFVVGVLTADCAPILFVDPVAKVVAAAHAGWRGAVRGIIEATIDSMEKSGADRSRIYAAIGPMINQKAYEVGPEFKNEFLILDPANTRFFKKGVVNDKSYFDLPGYVISRLKGSGIKSWQNASQCTYENESLFFSYRRATHRGEADYGRQVSAIVVT